MDGIGRYGCGRRLFPTRRHYVPLKPLYPQRIPVWFGFWAGGTMGPYCFLNEAGAAVSVNGWRYRTMINECLWPELEDIDVDDVYFPQDAATCHTSGQTIGLLREKFPG